MKTRRVLQVVGPLDRGGIETWLLRILRVLDQRRYRLDFLVHGDRPGAYDKEIERLGGTILRCPLPSSPLHYGLRFRRVLQEHGPYDVVQSQVYLFSGFVLRLAAGLAPVRIAHIHPLADVKPAGLARTAYRRLMTRWIRRYATELYAPSEAVLAKFLSLGDFSNQHRAIIPNCIEVNRFGQAEHPTGVRQQHGLPDQLPLVTYVARFAHHKNHRMLIRLADAVNRRGLRAHFLMVGSHGELMDEFRQTAKERPDVTLIDQAGDVVPLLMASDLCVFPSLEEGFGVGALEAAAAGLPVVATDLPSLREALPPGHRQLMFHPNDDQGALRSIESVLGDPAARQRLGEEGRAWAMRFSPEASVRALTQAWEVGLERSTVEGGSPPDSASRDDEKQDLDPALRRGPNASAQRLSGPTPSA